MKKLAIVIMAHKERAEFIPYLKEKLGDVPVVWDNKNDLWDTCRRAWCVARALGYEYSLVIQDDALITWNFREKAESLLSEDRIFSFYLSRLLEQRVLMAEEHKQNMVVSEMIFNEVAICMPTKYVSEMVAYCDEHEATTDQEIGRWARRAGKKIYYPIPSLVSHRAQAESIYRRNYNKPPAARQREAIRFYD